MSTRLLPFVLACSLAPLGAQTFVRVRDQVVAPRRTAPPTVTHLTSVTAAHCGSVLLALDGQPIVGSSTATIQTMAFMNPACLNRRGAMAFVANSSDPNRNQGIYVADGRGIHAIATGSGQGGGSGQHGTAGDPAPGGGTFAGFFGGTAFAPPINDDGDVLFLADVAQPSGPFTRSLFLYIAGAQQLVKVASVGDPSPLGGVITALGPGCLDRDRTVIFLAASTNSPQYVCDLLQWQVGTVTSFCATGDPAPGGATVAMLGTESFGFVDGTTVFAGPVPAVNDCGQVAFRILTNGGTVGRGIAVRSNGTDAWYLTDAMATPNGGTYFDFQGASINGSGDIAVFADYMLNGNPTSGWFAGRPGGFRHVLSFYDLVDGLPVLGLAYSRNPMTTLTDDGDVLVWCDIDPSSNGNMNRVVLCAADGSRTVLARQGGSTGAGGNYGMLDAWPSVNSTGRASISGGTTVGSAHIAAVLCGPAVASSPCVSLGDQIQVHDFGPAGSAFLLCASLTTQNVAVPPFGNVLIGGVAPVVTLSGVTSYRGLPGPDELLLQVPNAAGLVGRSLHFQSVALLPAGPQLTNRATATIR